MRNKIEFLSLWLAAFGFLLSIIFLFKWIESNVFFYSIFGIFFLIVGTFSCMVFISEEPEMKKQEDEE